MKSKILITDRFDMESLVRLKTHPRLDVYTSEKSNSFTPEECENTEGLIIRTRTKINGHLLEKFKSLKVIVSSTVGFDHIDLNETKKRGLAVMYCPGAHTDSATELTWALVLACAKKLRPAHAMVKKGVWERERLLGLELKGKTYGVIGLGRIGTRVAKIAQAFGMNLMAFDPYQEDSIFNELKIERSSFEEVLKASDVISVHVPLTKETHHLFNEVSLSNMSESTILVNTSRGSVVHEQALAKALEAGQLAAAGLDVFEYEPLLIQSPLLKMDHVVLSPHIGATTKDAFLRASQMASDKIIDFFEERPLSDTLPPAAAWFNTSHHAP